MERNFELIQTNGTGNSATQTQSTDTSQYLRLYGAMLGLLGGLLVALVGSMLTAISWIVGSTDHYLNAVSSDLLYLTIPLLVAGALCIDAFETHRRRQNPQPQKNLSLIRP